MSVCLPVWLLVCAVVHAARRAAHDPAPKVLAAGGGQSVSEPSPSKEEAATAVVNTLTTPDDDEHAGTHSAAGTYVWSMIQYNTIQYNTNLFSLWGNSFGSKKLKRTEQTKKVRRPTMPGDEHAGTRSAIGDNYLWSMIETYGTNPKRLEDYNHAR